MTALQNDRRAKILARLDELFTGLTVALTGGETPAATVGFVHNRNELPADMVPGIILLDADEVKDPSFLKPQPGRQLPPGATVMRMTPEIYGVLDVRKGAQQNVNVGEDLNLIRGAILYLIFHDATLQGIVGSNGRIELDACVTDLARNRTMKGQIGISVSFIYPLFPQELVYV